jgi:Lipocalin-like domain
MNKLKFISAFVIVFSTIIFSCTVEPYGGTQLTTAAPSAGTTTPPPPVTTVPVASVIGNYRLTAYNTSIPTDLNGNGTASVNQMLETTCFSNSSLTVNANGTFSVLDNYVDITTSGVPALTCATNNDSGTWTFAGNILTLTSTVGSVTQVQTGVFSGTVLTINVQDTEFINIVGGIPDYVDGNIQLVFTKQ